MALLAMALAFTRPQTAAAESLSKTVASDLRAIASPRTLEIMGVGSVLTVASLQFDDPDAAERNLGHGTMDGLFDFGNVYGGSAVLATAAAGTFGVGRFAHDPRVTRAGSEMIRSLVYTGVAVTTLKVAVHRTRPNGGPYSFPSGHTAAAFAVAPVLAHRFGWAAAIPAYALAASTAMGRMEDRKHYLSDVVFGAAIGTSIGLAVSSDHPSTASWQLALSPMGVGVSARF
jgi:membrane-associated phospholipid phosphatase